MSKTPKVRVTFQKAHGSFNKGETAGFLPAQAQNLIKAGIAVPFDAAAEQAAKDAATEAETLLAENEALRARLENLEAAHAAADKTAAEAGAPPPQGTGKKSDK